MVVVDGQYIYEEETTTPRIPRSIFLLLLGIELFVRVIMYDPRRGELNFINLVFSLYNWNIYCCRVR